MSSPLFLSNLRFVLLQLSVPLVERSITHILDLRLQSGIVGEFGQNGMHATHVDDAEGREEEDSTRETRPERRQ